MVFIHNMLIRLNPEGSYSIRTSTGMVRQGTLLKGTRWNQSPCSSCVIVKVHTHHTHRPCVKAPHVHSHSWTSGLLFARFPENSYTCVGVNNYNCQLHKNTDFLVCIFLQVKDFQSYTVNFEVAAFPDSFTLKFISNTNLAFINGIVSFECTLQQF